MEGKERYRKLYSEKPEDLEKSSCNEMWSFKGDVNLQSKAR